MLTIRTARLDLVAATLDHLRAEIEDPAALGRMLRATVPPDWPPGEYDEAAIAFFRAKLTEAGDDGAGWYTWYAIAREAAGAAGTAGTLIGAAGYMGPPDADGVVEIGYSVTPAARGAGYATEIVRALVERALAEARVRSVTARTSVSNAASRAVLEKNGFAPAGEGPDPGGLLYERRRA